VRKPVTENGVDGRVVTYIDRDSIISEQYRVLRTNLYSISPERPLKTIVITSAQSEEGKTTTACNLAYTISLDTQQKTLLVDSDLRRSAVHKMLGLPRKPGFSDLLNEKADVEYFLSKPQFHNLYVIPAGTAVDNPSELLSSNKMRGLIDTLKSKFDYIIFDAPPVINVTDASILGSISDAVFLVVKACITPKEMIEEAYAMLKRAQAEPRATILTGVTVPTHEYYLTKYRHYYKYRYLYSKPNSHL
jgi:capsular exopolysaccharide synthesis family protein